LKDGKSSKVSTRNNKFILHKVNFTTRRSAMSFPGIFTARTLARSGPNKRRTMLTMFGIGLGHSSPFTGWSARGEGLGNGHFRKTKENFWQKHVVIRFAGRTSMQSTGGASSGRPHRGRGGRLRPGCEEAPACKYVMPELGNNGPGHSLSTAVNLQLLRQLTRHSPENSQASRSAAGPLLQRAGQR